jgi:ubiquitin-conjugating enzyme E2 I
MEDRQEVNELIVTRLKKERKEWRQDHPFGFTAKPSEEKGGALNMLKWDCEIPGPAGSLWEGGRYKIFIDFTGDYPVR